MNYDWPGKKLDFEGVLSELLESQEKASPEEMDSEHIDEPEATEKPKESLEEALKSGRVKEVPSEGWEPFQWSQVQPDGTIKHYITDIMGNE